MPSRELAAHAESLGVDAIAAIPPIYFHLPPAAIAKYWNDGGAAHIEALDALIQEIPRQIPDRLGAHLSILVIAGVKSGENTLIFGQVFHNVSFSLLNHKFGS